MKEKKQTNKNALTLTYTNSPCVGLFSSPLTNRPAPAPAPTVHYPSCSHSHLQTQISMRYFPTKILLSSDFYFHSHTTQILTRAYQALQSHPCLWNSFSCATPCSCRPVCRAHSLIKTFTSVVLPAWPFLPRVFYMICTLSNSPP